MFGQTDSPQATVTTVWKTPVCKQGVCKRGILNCPVSYVLHFSGWIKLIFDTVNYCNFVINEFNPTSEVQNIENGVCKYPFCKWGIQLPLGPFCRLLLLNKSLWSTEIVLLDRYYQRSLYLVVLVRSTPNQNQRDFTPLAFALNQTAMKTKTKV